MSIFGNVLSDIYTIVFVLYNKIVDLYRTVYGCSKSFVGGIVVDGFVHFLMQLLTVVVVVGTFGVSFLVGAIWKKQKGY